ncbi:MAG: N-acyl-D-amino-acid deacylase family protein [Candidatus Cyclobacteriaceae bacterium M3_2C_046]
MIHYFFSILKFQNLLIFLFLYLVSCSTYDILIKDGTIYDGSGNKPYQGDVGIKKDKIKAIGVLKENKARQIIDAEGMAVSPGFINMLSWANWSLIDDGRSMSDIKQGVTLEVFGEGTSMGPVRPDHPDQERTREWTTLGEYLEFLEEKGVSTNVASFVGATTIRIHELGYENRPPTEPELKKMQQLVRQAMEEGALGLGSSLIYPPAFFAQTEELVALAKAAAEYNGMYISHLRSEGNDFIGAVDEWLTIADQAGIDAEIYHLKAAGQKNWHKLELVLQKIDSARKAGLNVSTNMYTYTAASTGLDACVPPWVQEGGSEQYMARLKDPGIRSKIANQIRTPSDQWENFYLLAGDPEKILLVGFEQDSLQYLTGKTLKEVAQMRNTDPVETIIDLLIENGGDITSVFFLMSEENVRKQLRLPYMSFGSDGSSIAAEGEELKYSTHPRTYGNFARLLGKYVREEKVLTLAEAIYKLTGLSAAKLKISGRGRLVPGYSADIVVFDPDQIQDQATFEAPHQYARGVIHVFVNGTQVIDQGDHTGAKPGRVVRGPGYKK